MQEKQNPQKMNFIRRKRGWQDFLGKAGFRQLELIFYAKVREYAHYNGCKNGQDNFWV